MTTLARELAGVAGEVTAGPVRVADFSGRAGEADAVVRPGSAEEVAALVAFCYARDVPIVARGGATGLAGGCVPDGGVVVDLARLARVRAFDPGLWRLHVEAGLATSHVQRLAREHGLWFPPDPGAAESSQIGGNIATNAGGPHAYKYGVTGDYVTGLEAVVAPGELVRVGGAIRKDVAGYDLKRLLIGSEGTLGIVTAAWLRLIPAPEATRVVAAAYPSARAGCEAIEALVGTGVRAAAIEYLDAGALAHAGATCPWPLPADAGFLVLAEADGSPEQAERDAAEIAEALGEQAALVADARALWRWRDGVSLAVAAARGAKLSDDVVVPIDRLAEMVEATVEIGRAADLEACSWGHAGDGNVHATFLISDAAAAARAEAAAVRLFERAVALGGSISGEHGVGLAKRGHLQLQWPPAALRLHRSIKDAFDPKGLLNPGKKT